jgi:hypothetical protein
MIEGELKMALARPALAFASNTQLCDQARPFVLDKRSRDLTHHLARCVA